ncbi:MAG: hypothetical protein SOZ71_10025 [Clostridium sp.]|nr:hypothetical protein [Clostridium sp.]
MIKLNDYLYSGDTVLKILQRYSDDLKESASQSQRIREFYKYMAI